MKVVTSAQMRDLDQTAIEGFGIPSLTLMENAGKAVAEITRSSYPEARFFAIFCGKGNNGGDGLVVARHLHQQGLKVEVFLLANESNLTGDSKTNLEALKNQNPVPIIHELSSEPELNESLSSLEEADIIIDALLGTGSKGPLHGMVAQAVDAINDSNKPVVSIDIPTGINPDKGFPTGKCIIPALTIMLGLPKLGLVTFPGAKYIGKIEIADIGIPDQLVHQKHYSLNYLTIDECSMYIPLRDPEGHKGKFGHVLVLAGSPGFTGAAALTSMSALRAGTGLVTLGTPSSLQPLMATKLTEVMTLGLPETNRHSLDINAEQMIHEFLNKATVIAVGPGLSTHEATLSLVRKLVISSPRPMVLDADALMAFTQDSAILKSAKVPVVLTPHPGEMSRLVHLTSYQVQANRINLAQQFSKQHNVYLVLKGAKTLIAEPSGQVYINPTGNPGMATAGAGDVLTGLIVGFMAQSLTPLEASILACYLHGMAGDLAAQELTEFCLTAGDILHFLPIAMKKMIQVRDS